MSLHQKIASTRKMKGLTQEELADLSQLTVRTIQRIESGENIPRAFTLKAIATALGMDFETLQEETPGTRQEAPQVTAREEASRTNSATIAPVPSTLQTQASTTHTLQMLCLFCFSFLIIPVIHFIIPAYFLQRHPLQNPEAMDAARKIVRGQVFWVVSVHLTLLLTLAFNMAQNRYWGNHYFINYLYPFFVLYFTNVCIIFFHLSRIKQISTH